VLVLACAALTLAALLYVFWLTPEPARVKSAAQRDREFLEERREVLYDNLRDLHLEYRMGKLSDSDYQQMKATYQAEMAALLAQMEKLPEAAAARSVPGRCARCGHDNPVQNRFCGACGAELPRAEELA
jgi:hypothetical protein